MASINTILPFSQQTLFKGSLRRFCYSSSDVIESKIGTRCLILSSISSGAPLGNRDLSITKIVYGRNTAETHPCAAKCTHMPPARSVPGNYDSLACNVCRPVIISIFIMIIGNCHSHHCYRFILLSILSSPLSYL